MINTCENCECFICDETKPKADRTLIKIGRCSNPANQTAWLTCMNVGGHYKCEHGRFKR